MRKVKTDNSDLIEYVNTVKELINHITIEEYRNEYRRLRSDGIPKSLNLHTLNFADLKKRENLLLNTLLTS